jgi:hypothetical protein
LTAFWDARRIHETTDSELFQMTEPTEPLSDGYRRVATAVYEQVNESAVSAAKVAAEYGKWLLQSLLLLNAGAITGIATYIANVSNQRSHLVPVLAWFIFGIILALGAGFAAWMNWQIHAEGYKTWADPGMIEDHRRFPKRPWPREKQLSPTHKVSVILGVLAAVMLLGGGFHAMCVLDSPASEPAFKRF